MSLLKIAVGKLAPSQRSTLAPFTDSVTNLGLQCVEPRSERSIDTNIELWGI